MNDQVDIKPFCMKKIALTPQDLERIVAAAKILSENLDKRITIPQLARMVKLSEKKLKAGFKQQYKAGVFGFHYACRMEMAKRLLVKNEPIKSIAANTGYCDEQAFITAFHACFEITPAQWRREELNKSIHASNSTYNSIRSFSNNPST
jgi:AraC-like DNA-binding protein